jgi:hypothetical protein
MDFLHRFSKKASISSFIKIRPVGAELLLADGQAWTVRSRWQARPVEIENIMIQWRFYRRDNFGGDPQFLICVSGWKGEPKPQVHRLRLQRPYRGQPWQFGCDSDPVMCCEVSTCCVLTKCGVSHAGGMHPSNGNFLAVLEQLEDRSGAGRTYRLGYYESDGALHT